MTALGRQENIQQVNACMTRLRVHVLNLDEINEQALKSLGASKVIYQGQCVHAVFGLDSDEIKRQLLQQYPIVGQFSKDKESSTPKPKKTSCQSVNCSESILKAFGGRENIATISHVASSRVRITLKQEIIDIQAATIEPVKVIMTINPTCFHLLAGEQAEVLCDELLTNFSHPH